MHSLRHGEKITTCRTGTTNPGSLSGDRRIASVVTGTSTPGPVDRRIAEPEQRSTTSCEEELTQHLLCDRYFSASPTGSTQLL
ncbi:hypothetical protein NDU88_001152 [Pleurodeles waltl]|uniref:Uncharacterized protein n=1 Tax=Pleurodeles waltl TaxID=8319 RepID=A0AAV7KRA5_PLEWA|nr:hypothetical protein NDU88_001152 [Pleurodeles waltl]